VERLPATALPVGAFPAWSSSEPSVELKRGDTVLLYSDGVTEAGIDSREEFGDERLLEAASGGSAEEIVDRICHCVAAWDTVVHDDCTVVALRCV
jgi:sigma-B regulation protein RsbU (phosphoserine phosphatase)